MGCASQKWLVLLVVLGVVGDDVLVATGDCNSQTTCATCIQIKGCLWCSIPGNFSMGEATRCEPKHPVRAGWREACGIDNIQEPLFVTTILQNKPFSEEKNNFIQMKPQKFNVSVPIDQPWDVDFEFKVAEKYPVDLYYLLDLSGSMSSTKQVLVDQVQQLVKEFEKLTNDLQMGFGSFVDKASRPYTSTIQQNSISPPYSFRNSFPLSSNVSQFMERVNASQLATNLDFPEGGLDALLQAIVCTQNIGWRKQARRVVIYASAASFHYAGDGRMAGILTPHDGMCYLDNEGTYTHSLLLDYPSVYQIREKAMNLSITVLFTVEKSQMPLYERLSNIIQVGSDVGLLESNSANFINLITNKYKELKSKVNLVSKAPPRIDVTLWTKCPRKEAWTTGQCEGLVDGDVIVCKATITILWCPKEGTTMSDTVIIKADGLMEELIIDVNSVCVCTCDSTTDPGYEEASVRCNGQGTYKCGGCECTEGYVGTTCQCLNNTTLIDGQIDTSTCSPPSNTSTSINSGMECTGRGQCRCGVCECNTLPKNYYGKYCQCSDLDCPKVGDELCAGHGTCQCGKCKCGFPYTGANCNCDTRSTECINPENKEICSGFGICECNECRCNKDSNGNDYSGNWCQDCTSCSPDQCSKVYNKCVTCLTTKVIDDPPDCSEPCQNFTHEVVPEVKATEHETKLCTFTDDEKCEVIFMFRYKNQSHLIVQMEKACPSEINVLALVISLVGLVVLIGLGLLLLWRCMVTIKDKREVARFDEDKLRAKWQTDNNPIYKQATTNFQNPMYETNKNR